MKKILLLALLIVGALILLCGFPTVTGDVSCPHPSFVTKHICQGCSTEKEALEFSQKRKKNKINTVLMGNPTFKMNEEGLCVNIEPVLVYKCWKRQRRCEKVGSKSITKHDPNKRGHFLYKDVRQL
jgi:hypothetical protein